MKASLLIKQLQESIAKNGDLEVIIYTTCEAAGADVVTTRMDYCKERDRGGENEIVIMGD